VFIVFSTFFLQFFSV